MRCNFLCSCIAYLSGCLIRLTRFLLRPFGVRRRGSTLILVSKLCRGACCYISPRHHPYAPVPAEIQKQRLLASVRKRKRGGEQMSSVVSLSATSRPLIVVHSFPMWMIGGSINMSKSSLYTVHVKEFMLCELNVCMYTLRIRCEKAIVDSGPCLELAVWNSILSPKIWLVWCFVLPSYVTQSIFICQK